MRFHLPAFNHGVMDPAPALYMIRIEVRQLELHRKSPESGNRCSP